MRYSTALSTFVAFGLSSSVGSSEALGQWALGVELGADRCWGASVESAPERRSFRPYRPTTFGVGIERRHGKLGIAIRLRYSEASLALEGSDALVAVKGVFKVFSATPEISYRIASVGPGNELLLHAGPLFEVWNLVDEESRARIGGQGSVSLNIPLGGRFGGSLSAGAAVMASPFTTDELAPGYDLRALWRRRFAVGLQYRLGS
jgi:hypothetical protein